METITRSKKNFNIAAIYVLKCQMYGKLKMPASAKCNLKLPNSNFIAAINAMEVNNPK